MNNRQDNLSAARAPVWITFVWVLLATVLLCVLALLAGCGGGIDTADEFMGPIADVKPCPANVTACHPPPSRCDSDCAASSGG